MTTPEMSTRMLYRGDWPGVLAADDFLPANLHVLHRMAAHGMRARTAGALDDARTYLEHVTLGLPEMLCTSGPDGRPLALITPQARGYDVAALACALARVVGREQAGLAELEDRFRPGKASARDALCAAGVERLRFIECASHLYARYADVRGVPFDAGCAQMCRRASAIRRYGNPRAGDVTASTWRAIGGYPGLRAAALSWLAAAPSAVPTTGPGALPADVPVCLGRLRAYQLALQWAADVVR